MPVLNMTPVATYVFLDLETTGLPKNELNKTKITELSMVAVRRKHVLDTRPGAAPRVLEKLTLCFNPRRPIYPESSEVSGLDNDLLEHQSPFNMNVFNTINSFLQCFEKPVCLIAQNGHSFDFPILKNHFEKLGVSLSDDILCADSLDAFYDIDVKRDEENVRAPGESVVDHETDGVETNESSNDRQQDNEKSDKIEARTSSDKQSNKSNTHSEDHITQELLKDFEENDDLIDQLKIQEQNERTPVQKQRIPEQKKANKVRRKLFFNKTGTTPYKKPEKSYRLQHVYERILGRPAIEAHRAENDCIMAMETSVALAKDFVEWVDNNFCKFSEVKAMKLGVPLGE